MTSARHKKRKRKLTAQQMRDIAKAIDDFLVYRNDWGWVYGLTGREVPDDLPAMCEYLQRVSAGIKSELKPKKVK